MKCKLNTINQQNQGVPHLADNRPTSREALAAAWRRGELTEVLAAKHGLKPGAAYNPKGRGLRHGAPTPEARRTLPGIACRDKKGGKETFPQEMACGVAKNLYICAWAGETPAPPRLKNAK